MVEGSLVMRVGDRVYYVNDPKDTGTIVSVNPHQRLYCVEWDDKNGKLDDSDSDWFPMRNLCLADDGDWNEFSIGAAEPDDDDFLDYGDEPSEPRRS
jgi:hypothetical protein